MNRKQTIGLLFGVLTVIAGCSATNEDATSNDQATTLAPEDDDEFDVEDRMGRPEMTNVTLGGGLVRLKVLKGALATETDPAKKAAIGQELAILGKRFGTPQSDVLKDALKNAAERDARAQQAIDGAKALATKVEEGLKAKAASESRALTEAEQKTIDDAKLAANNVRLLPPYFKAYNQQNTFHPRPGEWEDNMNLLGTGIAADDTIATTADGPPDARDWSDEDLSKILPVLAEDALVVDISKPCDADTQSFFAIEAAQLFGNGKYETCGGRNMRDDVIDDILTMWVKKKFDFSSKADMVVDHVIAVSKADEGKSGSLGPFTAPLSPTTSEFPYLGETREKPFVGLGSLSPSPAPSAE